ncbi:MAG TPA: kelch repeat-containing protein [Terriglobales bacterium]|nr:kelch repeat-containing protein [Terriglobales bacterium]
MGKVLVSRALARIAVSLSLLAALAGAQSWAPVKKPYPGSGAGAAFLLTDGTVMVHQEQSSSDAWYKLTPDINGSYANGTWTQAASISFYSPLFFGSAVLPDGRLLVEGGEYNKLSPVWTTKGAIYNPKTNKWKQVFPPSGWTSIGDAQGVILNDGTYMQSNCCTTQFAYFDPKHLTWTAFNGNGKFDVFDEEGFNLLPNGKVLSVDAYVFQYQASGMNSELYDPTTQTWSSAGSTGVQLWDSDCGNSGGASYEVGPAVLRPDGTVFATGANSCGPGHTSIYNTATGTWTPGPNFPGNVSVMDGPASIEINGKVLVMGSVNEGSPSTFYEWDGTNLTAAANPPNAQNDGSFFGHLLALPTGQILFADYSTDVELYNPAGTFDSSWAPLVTKVPTSLTRGKTYVAQGNRFAGVSQGGAYGDDYQPYTNYALVRLTNNSTGHVFYCKTTKPSSYAVQSTALQKTHFAVPAGAETGPSTLEVVTNGIPSQRISVTVN